jgi:transcriptional regulator with XRE-family HTH domain
MARLISLSLRKAFGRRLRQARKAADLSQDKLAEATGGNRAYIGEIERGSQNITLETASALARAVGYDLEIVWTPRQPPTPKQPAKK